MKPALVLAALLLAGCTAAPVPVAPLGLKDSCDALGTVLTSIDGNAPDAQRYADTLTKVQAIVARGDQTTKDTLQPLVQVLQQGAGGTSVTSEQGAAMFKLVMACGAAGSSFGGASPMATSAAPSPSPSPTSTLLDTKPFKVVLHEKSRKCTGSACVASVRVAVGYISADDLTRTTVLTYKVYGGNETLERNLTLDEDGFADEDFTVDVPKGAKLYALVSRVEQQL